MELDQSPLDRCPDASCQLPAAIVEHFTLDSTQGPLEHVAIRCLAGHQFVMPVDPLPKAS